MKDHIHNKTLHPYITSPTFHSILLKMIPFLQSQRLQTIANHTHPTLLLSIFLWRHNDLQEEKVPLKSSTKRKSNPNQSDNSFQTTTTLSQDKRVWLEDSTISLQKTHKRLEEWGTIPLLANKSVVGILLMKHLLPKAFTFKGDSTTSISN